MLFGNRRSANTAYAGLIKHGPYASAPEARPWIITIAPKASERVVTQKIAEPLLEGTNGFPGLAKFAHLNAELLSEPILYDDRKSPAADVLQQLERYPFPQDRRGVALLFSSIPEHDPNINRRREFFRIKEKLLQMGIVSQGFDEQKIIETAPSSLKWWHQHVATAILAKLGGVPWKAGEGTDDELIIGIGAFRPRWSPKTFAGSAFSFDNSGRFHNFDFFEGSDIDHLCGGIRQAVNLFVREKGRARRVVIHYYKELKRDDERKINQVFYDLNCEIPVYLVTINKSFGHDEVVIDGNSAGGMPVNGTWVDLGRNRFLLFNNQRTGEDGKSVKSFPFQLKLSVREVWNDAERSLMRQLTRSERLERLKVDEEVVSELMGQVIRFSKMYWKSVNPQPLPVTIAYPDLLARQVCWFDSRRVPIPVKNVPFFL
jgi:hypothetical protein